MGRSWRRRGRKTGHVKTSQRRRGRETGHAASRRKVSEGSRTNVNGTSPSEHRNRCSSRSGGIDVGAPAWFVNGDQAQRAWPGPPFDLSEHRAGTLGLDYAQLLPLLDAIVESIDTQ